MDLIYTGGLEIECSLVPTLSFLKDMIQKTNALPPAVVLDRVSHSIGKMEEGWGGGWDKGRWGGWVGGWG